MIPIHFRKNTPIIYLSGFFSAVKKGPNGKEMSLKEVTEYWRKKSGAKYRCYSAMYLAPKMKYFTKRMNEVYELSLKREDGILMDSGAHSFHNFMKAATGKISSKKRQKMSDVASLRDEHIAAYIDFIKADGRKWDLHVNFDYVHDPEECYRVQHVLWKAGANPMPVVHGDEKTFEYFRRYCKDGAKIIGLGTGGINNRAAWDKKRVYYDMIFNLAAKHGVRIHGFAQTYLSMMFFYDWYSVDSATWAKCSAFGKLIFPDTKSNTLRMIHVSDRHSVASDLSYNKSPKNVRKAIERQINDYGFDFEKVRTNLIERYCFNAHIYAQRVHELKEIVEASRAKWKSLLL